MLGFPCTCNRPCRLLWVSFLLNLVRGVAFMASPEVSGSHPHSSGRDSASSSRLGFTAVRICVAPANKTSTGTRGSLYLRQPGLLCVFIVHHSVLPKSISPNLPSQAVWWNERKSQTLITDLNLTAATEIAAISWVPTACWRFYVPLNRHQNPVRELLFFSRVQMTPQDDQLQNAVAWLWIQVFLVMNHVGSFSPCAPLQPLHFGTGELDLIEKAWSPFSRSRKDNWNSHEAISSPGKFFSVSKIVAA